MDKTSVALTAALMMLSGVVTPVYAEENVPDDEPTAPHLGLGRLALGIPSDSVPASTPEPSTASTPTPVYSYSGAVLTPTAGRISGPSGVETYYNLDMSGVVANTKNAGVAGDYWVREDGVKMYGNYVIAACDISGIVHNRYDVVETSLGSALCMDTGTFAASDPHQIDIAVTW